eukprot:scaffold1908_cov104-Isochrysis_galbana.AAC.2
MRLSPPAPKPPAPEPPPGIVIPPASCTVECCPVGTFPCSQEDLGRAGRRGARRDPRRGRDARGAQGLARTAARGPPPAGCTEGGPSQPTCEIILEPWRNGGKSLCSSSIFSLMVLYGRTSAMYSNDSTRVWYSMTARASSPEKDHVRASSDALPMVSR